MRDELVKLSQALQQAPASITTPQERRHANHHHPPVPRPNPIAEERLVIPAPAPSKLCSWQTSRGLPVYTARSPRAVLSWGSGFGGWFGGAVASSSRASHCRAWAGLAPHISAEGCKDKHTAGRAAWPNRPHRPWGSSCTQRTPAGLPSGMPGMGELMDGAMQQAAQAGRQASGEPPATVGDVGSDTGADRWCGGRMPTSSSVADKP